MYKTLPIFSSTAAIFRNLQKYFPNFYGTVPPDSRVYRKQWCTMLFVSESLSLCVSREKVWRVSRRFSQSVSLSVSQSQSGPFLIFCSFDGARWKNCMQGSNPRIPLLRLAKNMMQKVQKASATGSSQAVTHLSTIQARRFLTSVFCWEPVLSSRYERCRQLSCWKWTMYVPRYT